MKREELLWKAGCIYYRGRLVFREPWLIKNTDKTKTYREFLGKLDTVENPLGYVGTLLYTKNKGEGIKKAYELTGITQTALCGGVNRLVFENLVKPNKHLLGKLAKGLGGFYNQSKAYHVLSNKELLNQLVEDGLDNLLPFVNDFRQVPKRFREVFGKGLWRKIHNNSFHRNQLLCNLLHPYCTSLDSRAREKLKELIDYPSGLLKLLNKLEYNEPKAIITRRDHYNESWTELYRSVGAVSDWVNVYRDTRTMATRLNVKFKESWSYNEIITKHDEFTHEIEKIKDREYLIPFESVGDFKDYHFNGVDCILLDTPEKLHREGEYMRHCVYSYTQRVRSGRCVIYSMSDGTNRSTVEIQLSGGKVRSIGQHDGRFRKNPEESLIRIANFLLSELRKVVNGR